MGRCKNVSMDRGVGSCCGCQYLVGESAHAWSLNSQFEMPRSPDRLDPE